MILKTQNEHGPSSAEIPGNWSWRMVPGLCGTGTWGQFRCIEHISGFRVTYFPASNLVVCDRPVPFVQWHSLVVDALKTDAHYLVAPDKAGNICSDILGFLLWAERYSQTT